MESMNTEDFYTRFFVALAIGLVLGIERGWKQRTEHTGEREAGIRTFALVALTGFASGAASDRLGAIFPAIMGVGLLGLVVVSYFNETAREKADRGMTTEVAIMLTFVLGVLCASGALTESALIAVVTLTLLDQKALLHQFVSGLQRVEIIAVLKILLVGVILLPVLPNQGYGPGSILNPYELCWAVVVIATLSLAGYAAIRIAGPERGALVMGLFGGMVSSTSVTVSASRASADAPEAALPLAGAIAIAQSIMFVRTAALVFTLNQDLFPFIVMPLALGALVALGGASIVILQARRSGPAAHFAPGSPDALGTAVKFIAVVATVLVASHYAQQWAGGIGVIIGGLLSGAVDVDAATVSASRLTSTGIENATPFATGATAIAIAVLANSIVKAGIATSLGTRPLAWNAGTVLVASGAATLAAAFVSI
jgi:uncharacterized membrane protein (DUF4010 family)